MRKIIYYVATSLDGYIAGPNGEISGFANQVQGDGVKKYFEDLQNFDTVIMGRKTYEFGYQYGLEAGQLAYPHMDHFIFSKTLVFENQNDKIQVCDLDISIIKALKEKEGSDIYLCGGGDFAAWLLEHEMIDVLKIKLNPLVLGDGIRFFGASKKQYQLTLLETEIFEEGLQIITYKMEY